MFDKYTFGKGLKMNTEIVNGICPACTAKSVFISLCANHYRCTTCGINLEQKINGVISYIPAVSIEEYAKSKLHPDLNNGPKKT